MADTFTIFNSVELIQIGIFAIWGKYQVNFESILHRGN